ncbi:acylphosphatase [Bacillus sp. H-16]|uniref:acylphosphatase n=1 Tax=Alteribacter salitolerans TaxID=2912333 RepID=UPI0019643545|nr:acylphosphatase [Alteribacter salitolerans]MBM7095814.1 acylphosphatase [Alteribacter salitolerans]
MVENQVSWLPHLTEEIVSDARGPELDAYAIALEGWRRGLTLRWHAKDSEKFSEMDTWFVDRPGKLFSLSSEDKTHYFFRTRGDKVTNEAVRIGGDKEETKKHLIKAGVPTPKGKRFKDSKGNQEEIIKYASEIGFPVVVKPTDGSFGRGVITNLLEEPELVQALHYLNVQLGFNDIIIEQHVKGEDLRIYVVGDKVVGAIKRVPANVIGDGVNTIKGLIDLKNQERKKNPRLISCPIKINDDMKYFINSNNYTFTSIPAKGELVYLTNKSNISIGGDPYDVLDEVSVIVKETAIAALNSVPGLVQGAVDLMVDKEEGKYNDKVEVIELNPSAQIGSLLFPIKGKSRDVPSAIIEYYFPETIGTKTDYDKIYFSLTDVLEPLVSRTSSIATVSPAPLGKIYASKYTVKGNVQNISYHRGLRKQAFERKLSGFVKNLSNSDIEVVVLGTCKESIDDFKNALLEDPERSAVYEIIQEDWTDPVKIGFEVKADLKTQIEQFRFMKQQMSNLKRELRDIEKHNKKFTKSFSWRITFPFRKLNDLVKFLKRKVG